jgi:hypothetical protein
MRFMPLACAAGLQPGHVRFSGRITGAGGSDEVHSVDEVLWADVPEAFAADATERLDAWLLWLLPHAFEAGEDLLLDGPVDAELLRNAHELMEVWACWRPDKKPVRVTAEPADATEPRGARKGLFFTAGVDSFFSLLHHDEMARLHPEWNLRPIDDLIYVEGYDIPLAKRDSLDHKRAALQSVAQETGKTLVTLTTNFRDTGVSLRKNAWGPIVHGPAVAASGLLLGHRWDTLLLSAAVAYDEFDPWGSTCLTDPLCSTSSTRVWHYGAGADRLHKIEFLALSDVAIDHLHVCWRDASERNCGTCEKCFRTLLALDMAGARDRARTFPAGDFSMAILRDLWSDREPVKRMYRKMRDRAHILGRADVVSVIDECLSRPSSHQDPSR